MPHQSLISVLRKIYITPKRGLMVKCHDGETSNVLTREMNAFQQQMLLQSTLLMDPNSASTQTSNLLTKRIKRNPGVHANSTSTRLEDVLKAIIPKAFPEPPAVIVLDDVEDDKRSTPNIENFTIYWNSKKDTNSITILNNSAARSKKLLKFHFGKVIGERAKSEVRACTICIDGVEIAFETGKNAKIAKQLCADTAYERLKESQPIVDNFKEKEKKKNKKKHQTSEENLENMPLALRKKEYTNLKITTDSTGRSISTQVNETLVATTVAQNKRSSDVVIGSKEKAKKARLFTKNNTSVEVPNPSVPPNLYPEIPTENIGHQLLKRMGWTGGGLGRQGNEGRVEPIMHARLVRRRQGLGVDLSKQPGWKMSKQVRNIKPSEITTNKPVSSQSTSQQLFPLSALTISNQVNHIKSSTSTSQSSSNINQPATTNKSDSNIVQPSSATAKPMCNIKSLVTTTVQPFAATTSKSASTTIQPSLPRLSASNINQPFAATTNKSDSNIVQPSSATTTKPVCKIKSETFQPFAATTSKSVSTTIQPSSAMATIKPVCNIKLSATATIQPFSATTSKSLSNTILPSFATPRQLASNINQPTECKTSQSLVDVDMLFKPTSTNSAKNGVRPHLPPLMARQPVFKGKTTISQVITKPVASTVKASLPTPNNSVRDIDMLPVFQSTSTRSVRNGVMSGASKSVIAKQLSCVTSNPVGVIDVDMVTAPTNAIRNADIEISVKGFLLNIVRNFLKSSEKELKLTDQLTRESRISLFRLCDTRGLQFQSFIKAKKRIIIISKPGD